VAADYTLNKANHAESCSNKAQRNNWSFESITLSRRFCP